MTKVIGIVSLKGGVGKTSIVSGLGAALAGFGKKVLLIDANLSAPNLGMHLNIINPTIGLHHVLARRVKPSEAVYKLDYFDIIPTRLFDRTIVDPLKLKDRIKLLKKRYDIVLLDSSPALNDETLAVLLAADEILVVTTPDHPTLSITLKAIKLARQRGTPIQGLILNKVYKRNFELSIDDIEDVAEVPVMAVIPHDINMLKALFEFTPSTIHKPRSEGSEELKKLAATILGEKYDPFGFRWFFRRISPQKQDINRTIFYERIFEE